MKIDYKKRIKILKNFDKLLKYKKIYSIPDINSCLDFINRFCFTYDPRNKIDKVLPFELFPKQIDFISWLWDRYVKRENGIVDKCRDVGATWCVIAFYVWLILFHDNVSCGLFTYKASECDRLGDISTLFGKIRFLLKRLPRLFISGIESNLMYIKNVINDSDIAGASGDNPGRGGRRTIFIKDESAFYQHAEMIEASLSETSDCIIDVSTHAGTNTVFYNKISSSIIPVFTFDWWENPNHSQEWYDKKKEQAMAEGLLHIFKREIERDPNASVESVVIPSEWVSSTKKSDIKNNGKIIAALDVADEGADTNALSIFDGNELIYLDEWSEGDTAETAQYAFWKAIEFNCDEFRYDNIGVGAGVKAHIRIMREKLKESLEILKTEFSIEKDMKKRLSIGIEIKEIKKSLDMKIKGWSASGKVIRPEESDFHDKFNNLLFENAKAQAYWKLRDEFRHSYRYVNGKECDKSKVLYFGEDIKKDYINKFNKLLRELSQPQHKLSASGKIIIDKKPKGTKSPNLAESFMIARAEIEETWISWDVV